MLRQRIDSTSWAGIHYSILSVARVLPPIVVFIFSFVSEWGPRAHKLYNIRNAMKLDLNSESPLNILRK